MSQRELKSDLFSDVAVDNPKCLICGHGSITRVNWVKYLRWQNGEMIDQVFTDFTPAQREVMISGTHPYCWDKMHPEGEDDE
jgi:hypothetical protein